MSILGDLLEPFATPAPQPPEKKVRFAPFFDISRAVPWSQNRAASPGLGAFNRHELLPQPSGLKPESIYYLRTEMRTGDSLTAFGMLLALFLVIWYIVHTVLLLEVESEIGKRATRSAGKFD
jgi:hypothetical protein